MRYSTLLVAPVAAIMACAGPLRATEADLTRFEKAYVELNAMEQQELGQKAQRTNMQRLFDTEFSPALSRAELMRLSPRDVSAAFRAASDLAYYWPDQSHLDIAKNLFSELERRHLANTSNTASLYEAFFQVRRFDEMSQFYAAHPNDGLQVPPRLIGAEGPAGLHRMLEIQNATTLKAGVVDVSKGAHIVVISNPACHYTRWAVDAIEHDKALSKVFSGHSTWLAPADRNISLTPFVLFNAAHPTLRINLVATDEGWPEVEAWQTPIFLFFKDGHLTDRIIGWPKEGSAAEVEKDWAKATGDT